MAAKGFAIYLFLFFDLCVCVCFIQYQSYKRHGYAWVFHEFLNQQCKWAMKIYLSRRMEFSWFYINIFSWAFHSNCHGPCHETVMISIAHFRGSFRNSWNNHAYSMASFSGSENGLTADN